MNIRNEIRKILKECGPATVDEVVLLLPTIKPKKISAALYIMKYHGYVILVGKKKNPEIGKSWNLYSISKPIPQVILLKDKKIELLKSIIDINLLNDDENVVLKDIIADYKS